MKIKSRKYKKRKQTKKLKIKHKGGSDDSFGFIFTRCVRNKEDNQIWINCYKSIRKFYKEKILIITDGSNKELIEDIPLENVQLIDSEFHGAGEILPYYYFQKLKPFNKAICMHDSMWFVNKFDFKNYDLKDVIFLWYFTSTNRHFPDKEVELAKLTNKDEVLKLYETNNWNASFGACSYITLDFVNKLNTEYNFLSFVNILGKERSYRHSLERIFGVLCYLLSDSIKTKTSLFGDWGNGPTVLYELKNLDAYDINKENNFMVKLTRGR